MRLVLLALLLLAPSAGALAALEESPRLGALEARVLVRAQGALRVVADGPLAAATTPPGGEADAFVGTPATLLARAGEWRGLAGVTDIVLRRASPAEARVVDVADATGAGLTFTWPAMGREVPAAGPGALLALALAWALALCRLARKDGHVR